jgi:hypothetical protein
MKERQNAQQNVVLGEANDFIDRADIRAYVVMREHDALWPACRAGGKNHGEQIVGLNFQEAEFALDKRDRQPTCGGV